MDIATLKDRLRGIVKPASQTDVASGFSRTRSEEASDFSQTLCGSWRETSAGRSYVVTHRFAPADFHGRHRVSEFAETLQ
jgi:hypothetical protein